MASKLKSTTKMATNGFIKTKKKVKKVSKFTKVDPKAKVVPFASKGAKFKKKPPAPLV